MSFLNMGRRAQNPLKPVPVASPENSGDTPQAAASTIPHQPVEVSPDAAPAAASGPHVVPAGETLLSVYELVTKLGVSRSSILAWEKDGSFPTSILIGRKLRRWRRSEVETWIAQRHAP